MMIASTGTTLLAIGVVTTAILLIGLVLLQKNRGAGLSGAFGGVGGHSAFGTKTGDFLTWVTVGLAALFLLLNVVGNFVFEPERVSAPTAAVGTAGPTDASSLPGSEGAPGSPTDSGAADPAGPAAPPAGP